MRWPQCRPAPATSADGSDQGQLRTMRSPLDAPTAVRDCRRLLLGPLRRTRRCTDTQAAATAQWAGRFLYLLSQRHQGCLRATRSCSCATSASPHEIRLATWRTVIRMALERPRSSCSRTPRRGGRPPSTLRWQGCAHEARAGRRSSRPCPPAARSASRPVARSSARPGQRPAGGPRRWRARP